MTVVNEVGAHPTNSVDALGARRSSGLGEPAPVSTIKRTESTP